MKQELVEVNLHGVLGEAVGHKTWTLSVKTVGAAINAIEVLSQRKLFKFLSENDKNGIKYQILINGRDFNYDKENPPSLDNKESILNSELCAKVKDLKTIDIVPVLSGAGNGGGMVVLGVFLIILAILLLATPFGVLSPYIFMIGVGLIAAGIMQMLTKPPEMPSYRETAKKSYLFSGPVNVVNEGGPIPIGYGRLMIGSAIISASYDIGYFDANDNYRTVKYTPPTTETGGGYIHHNPNAQTP